MKIYEIEGRLRRLGLIDEEIGIIGEIRYLFVAEGKQDIELVEYAKEALERGIEIWKGTTGQRVTKFDKNHVSVWEGILLEFVIEKAEDEEWIRTLIKKILVEQAKPIDIAGDGSTTTSTYNKPYKI